MPPVKFDDLGKPANEVLNDDYTVKGYSLKTKQKTSYASAVLSSAVDLWPGKEGIQTPAKLTWKVPKPFGVAGLSVDKLEMTKDGKYAFEVSADKTLHKVDGLHFLAKSDLQDPAKASTVLTFTGLADTQIKFETKPMNVQDFTLEVTRSMQQLTFGAKCKLANISKPDVGLKIAEGPFAMSVFAKDAFKVFPVSACYKVSDDVKVAATYEQGGKNSGNFTAGLAYTVQKGTLVKAKVQQDKSLSASVKHEVAKGFTVTAGGKYGLNDGKYTYGLQLSVE